MSWIDQIEIFIKDGRTCVRVRVQPRSGRNQVVGSYGKALKIRLTAPPLENRANLQLQEFLTRLLKLEKGEVTVISGLRSRTKTIGFQHLSKSELLARLIQYLV